MTLIVEIALGVATGILLANFVRRFWRRILAIVLILVILAAVAMLGDAVYHAPQFANVRIIPIYGAVVGAAYGLFACWKEIHEAYSEWLAFNRIDKENRSILSTAHNLDEADIVAKDVADLGTHIHLFLSPTNGSPITNLPLHPSRIKPRYLRMKNNLYQFNWSSVLWEIIPALLLFTGIGFLFGSIPIYVIFCETVVKLV